MVKSVNRAMRGLGAVAGDGTGPAAGGEAAGAGQDPGELAGSAAPGAVLLAGPYGFLPTPQ